MNYIKYMKTIDINNIYLEKISQEMKNYEREWIAISELNKIVAHGNTYGEALKMAKDNGFGKVILFKVPPLNYPLSPLIS